MRFRGTKVLEKKKVDLNLLNALFHFMLSILGWNIGGVPFKVGMILDQVSKILIAGFCMGKVL